jgi:hypothetical protein
MSDDWAENAPESGERPPVRVKNLDTGEVYSSLTEAGRKLGFLSNLKVPKKVGPGDRFEKGGVSLELMK